LQLVAVSTPDRTRDMGEAKAEAEEEEVHHCQACHLPSSRKCSACRVCIFCSLECEESAAKASRARIACAEHQKRARAPENLGASAAHFVMLPTTPLRLSRAPASAPSQMLWEALFHATQHYMYLLLSCSSSAVHERTAFGMAVVIVDNTRLGAGCQRCAFPVGKRSDAAAMMIGNMAALARAQLGRSTVQRAILVSGVVQTKEAPQVHFDAIYVVRDDADDAWTIRGIKPLWSQTLVPTGNVFYKMHYRPTGHAPTNTRHALALVERALSPPPANPSPVHPPPPTPSEPPPARPKAPGPRPMPASSAPAAAPAPGARAQAPPQSPRPESAPAPTTWEALRARAQAEAEATTEAPQWTAQLLEALRQDS
jgi:hypothetical protein